MTISTYTGDGSTTQFDITFDYRESSTIKASVDGVETEDFSFVNPSRISFLEAPASGAEIKIFRRTAITPPAVEFEDGAIILGDDLNEAIAQPRDRVEELTSSIDLLTGRAVQVPLGEGAITIDAAEDRAGSYLAFDASGNPVSASGTGADAGLRTDLAAASGAALLGTTAGITVEQALTLLRSIIGIRPEDYGAVGDGITDDTAAVQAWAADILNGTRARADGDYLIAGQMQIVGKSNFIIEGSGTFTVAAGSPTNELYSIFHFIRCSDFLVQGLTLDGNRDARTPAEDSGHLLRIIGSSHRVVIRNVAANNGTTDGFFVAAEATGNGTGGGPLESELPSDIVFWNCFADNNWRQGLSLVDGHRISVLFGRYSNTTGAYTVGNGPCAGIDVESDPQPTWMQTRLKDILVQGVVFDGNDGAAFLVVAQDGVENVNSVSCTFRNNKLAAFISNARGVKLIDPYFDGWDNTNPTTATKRGLIDIQPSALGYCKIVRPKFRNITANLGGSLFLYYSHATGVGHNEMIDPDVEDSSVWMWRPGAPHEKLSGPRALNSYVANAVGDDAVIQGATIYGGVGSVIQVQGARSVIRDSKVFETDTSAGGPAIRAIGADAVIENNDIHRAVDSTSAPAIQTDAAAERVSNNRMWGYGAAPLSLAGTTKTKRGNTANGTLLSETAIVP